MPMKKLLLCVTALAVVSAVAHAQTPGPAPVLYRLTRGSTFERGCFDPCECPLQLGVHPHGTFNLTRTDSNPLFDIYAVTDVAWTVALGGQDVKITGSGTYRIGGEVAVVQQLQLDLAVGGATVQRFDGGLVPVNARFPAIDVVISIHGMYCYDTVIRVVAVPATLPTSGGDFAKLDPYGAVADFFYDGDVDLSDFSHFQACFNGPNRSPTMTDCGDADLDADSDVDLADFTVFQACFNGPNRLPACL
jgi:hypothetical protein